MIEVIYTIGFTKKPLRKFLTLLGDAGVDVVLDLRRHNTSQLAGYAKRDDLACILELAGIGYQHVLALAPNAELLSEYQHKILSWEEYAASYLRPLEQSAAQVEALVVVGDYRRPALLCAEDSAEWCHRRLAAEWLQAGISGVDVVHLR